jgi:hypothetical protein
MDQLPWSPLAQAEKEYSPLLAALLLAALSLVTGPRSSPVVRHLVHSY